MPQLCHRAVHEFVAKLPMLLSGYCNVSGTGGSRSLCPLNNLWIVATGLKWISTQSSKQLPPSIPNNVPPPIGYCKATASPCIVWALILLVCPAMATCQLDVPIDNCLSTDCKTCLHTSDLQQIGIFMFRLAMDFHRSEGQSMVNTLPYSLKKIHH